MTTDVLPEGENWADDLNDPHTELAGGIGMCLIAGKGSRPTKHMAYRQRNRGNNRGLIVRPSGEWGVWPEVVMVRLH